MNDKPGSKIKPKKIKTFGQMVVDEDIKVTPSVLKMMKAIIKKYDKKAKGGLVKKK